MISDTLLSICRVFSGSSGRDTCLNDLPEDVHIEILLRLPVNSLLRFKVVSKAWKSHISNPEFVKRHNVMTTTNPNNEYIIAENDSSHNRRLCAFNINFMHRAVSLKTRFFKAWMKPGLKGFSCISSLNPPMAIPGDKFNVVGSCNGLLCLDYCSRSRTEKLYLWNLATRKVKELPGTALKMSILEKKCGVSVLGFGFDFARSDYKVVRIVRTSNKSSVSNRVEVYSLIKNSWKEIEVKLNFGEPWDSYSLAFVKGSLYWTIIYSRILLSFNVQSEDFCTIPVPPNALFFHLFEFKESVALIDKVDRSGIINLWTLDDHSCWIKKVAINFVGQIIGCLKTGEILGRTSSNELVLYDSVTGERKHKIPFKMHTRRTYNYSESLVNLN